MDNWMLSALKIIGMLALIIILIQSAFLVASQLDYAEKVAEVMTQPEDQLSECVVIKETNIYLTQGGCNESD